MEKNLQKELLKSIEIIRCSVKNNFEITTESYVETQSRLDLLTYLIISEGKNSTET